MQPFMTLYRRGNSEELTDRMTGSGSSHRCAMHKGTIRRRSCAIRSQWQRTFHDLKQVEMTFVAMAIPCNSAGSRCSVWPSHSIKNIMAVRIEPEHGVGPEELGSRA